MRQVVRAIRTGGNMEWPKKYPESLEEIKALATVIINDWRFIRNADKFWQHPEFDWADMEEVIGWALMDAFLLLPTTPAIQFFKYKGPEERKQWEEWRNK